MLSGINTVRLSELLNYRVNNAKGENLGKIEDLVIDYASGQCRYAVLSFGGFFGIGKKYFAVPISALQPDYNKKCVTINIDKEKLKNAPGFDKHTWPNIADAKWDQMIQHFFDLKPIWEAKP